VKVRLVYVLIVIFFSFQLSVFAVESTISPTVSMVKVNGEDVFIKLVIAKKRVFVGEAFTLSYQLYSKVRIMKPDLLGQLTFTDCEARLIEEPPKTWTKKLNGEDYQVLQLASYVIIPLRHGRFMPPAIKIAVKLTLPPAEDDFFEQERELTRTITSQAIELSVIPLPPLSASKKFARTVGQFEVKTSYNPNGQTLGISIIVRGTGSLRSFTISPIKIPAGLTQFDKPGIASDTIISGKLLGRYYFFAEINSKYKGRFIIPGQVLYYFDPLENKYEEFVIDGYQWDVKKGEPLPAHFKAALAKNLPPKIFYHKITKTNHFEDKLFNFSAFFWVLIISSIGLLITGKLLSYGKLKKQQSPAFLNKRAYKNAQTRLKQLIKTNNTSDQDFFLRQLNAIFSSYCSDRFGILPGEFSLNKLKENQEFFKLDKILRERIVDLVQTLHHYRFNSNQDSFLERAVLIEHISEITKKIEQNT